MDHKYQVGQEVYYNPPIAASRMYKIIAANRD
jgi:hypothetical protein